MEMSHDRSSYYSSTRKRFQEEGAAERYEKRRAGTLKGKFVRYREEIIVRKILEKFAKNLRILDVPCGAGRLSAILKDYSDFIVGADISEPMLEYSKKSGRYAKLDKCEIESMPYENNCFDVLFCFRLLHHLPIESRSKAFSEVSRVTKKYFIFSFNDNFSISHFVKKSILKNPFYTVATKHMKEEVSKNFIVRKTFRILPLIAGETVFLCEKRMSK
jgi:ubiquinone/menaquinone biosynthesis C-methylase UbiE